MTATQQPDQKPVSLSQELLAAAAVPAAISQEVIFQPLPLCKGVQLNWLGHSTIIYDYNFVDVIILTDFTMKRK